MKVHLRLRKLSFVLLGAVLAPASAGFAADGVAMTIGQTVTIHSRILNEDRVLWIHDPDTASNSKARYPVIYLLDGDSHFLQTCGIAEFLSRNNRLPRMIVVGILNTKRNRDLTPPPADTSVPGSGGADTFLQCVREEIIPFVESHHKAAGYRVLIGHSFGGIFVLNALFNHPETFNAFVAISPSLWWGHDTLISRAREFLRRDVPRPVWVYETIGDEGPEMVSPSLQMKDVVDANPVHGVEWKVTLRENDDHGSIVLKSIYDGLEFIFPSWRIRENLVELGIRGIERHFRNLSEKYGFEAEVPELMVNSLGYQYLSQNNLTEAITVFQWNVDHYPGSWNVYDSLGEALAKRGDTKRAIENYETSVRMNPQNTNGIEILKRLKAQ